MIDNQNNSPASISADEMACERPKHNYNTPSTEDN